MAKSSRARPNEDEIGEAARAERQAAVIGAAVMSALGRPADFFRVSVVRLWGNHFRVNVQTGPDASSVRVAHSFFLTADEHGQVVASNPAITRLY